MGLFSSDAERQRVAERVTLAEQRTAGEIVVVVARRSGDYGVERAAFSGGLTLLLALTGYFFLAMVPELWLLCLQAPLGFFAWWLSGLSPVLRRLVPTAAQHAVVRARAQQLFMERGVTETRQRSGVLLYLSEGEHRVELLADRGIHERVGAEGWQRVVDQVVGSIREGHAADGIAAAVDSIGQSLALHFPREADDVNELPDAVTRL
jgi:putative membrane protein